MALMMMSLSACEKSSIGTNGCLNFPIIHTSKNDILTRQTKAEIVIHDMMHEKICN